jgi:hypothetical protein
LTTGTMGIVPSLIDLLRMDNVSTLLADRDHYYWRAVVPAFQSAWFNRCEFGFASCAQAPRFSSGRRIDSRD